MLRSPRAALLVTLVAFALALAACGSSSTTPAPTTAPAASTPASAPSPEASTGGGGAAGNAVTIQNFSFGPATLDVAVGTTVTWTNKDSTNHTVTANDGSFDSKAISSGTTFSQTFATAGTFAYHCSIHSTMTATITVK